MVYPELIRFIKKARKRGFDDYQIKDPLLKKGWPLEEIELAFASLKQIPKFKNKVCIYVDSDVIKTLEKRAKRNLFTVSEQIDDILRRSAISAKKIRKESEKLDDLLVSIFSGKDIRR